MRCPARVAGLLLLLALGCGERTMTADVSGKVTVDGQPIEDGAITLFPIDGKGVPAGGAIEDGEYSVPVPIRQGQVLRMKVSISVPKVVGMKKPNDLETSVARPIPGESLPEKYNAKSELTIDVKPGRNEKNWDLKSR